MSDSILAEHMKVVFFNLVLLILSGLALSGYCLYYTDYFPIVGGLLGLGGFFSWIAFLSNVITDARKEELQAGFDRLVLQRHRTWMGLMVVLVLFMGWAAGRGTIMMASPGDDLDHVVSIWPEPSGDEETAVIVDEHLAPHSSVKYLLPTSWWGSRSYRVKVSGLPATTAEVSAWRRTLLVAPGSFLRRPVLLVRPDSSLSATLARPGGGPFRLEVSVESRPIGHLEPYRGEAIWIGTEADVPVPSYVRDRWRLELAVESVSEVVLTRWLVPLSVGDETVLRPGDRVTLTILHPGGEVYVRRTVKIAAVAQARDFPQEVKLDETQ